MGIDEYDLNFSDRFGSSHMAFISMIHRDLEPLTLNNVY